MSSLMAQIEESLRRAPRRVMLYGTAGIGKSTWGAQAPKPVFVPTEDGLGGIECARFPLAENYPQVIEALSALYAEEHDYQTVVIDTLDWLERLIWAEVCRKRGVESIEDIGYAKGYVFALTQWREVLEGLQALRTHRGMMVVLIAHAQVERFQSPMADTYDRYGPRLHRQASAMVQEWVDELLFACYRVQTKVVDEGFDRKRTRAIGQAERVVYTTEGPAHVAKHRLPELPDELPLEYAAYAHYLPSPELRQAGLPAGVANTPKSPTRHSQSGDGANKKEKTNG